jgi:DNA primase
MAFPPGFLDELRSRVSLADLIGRRVRLVRRGREHSGLCPFHNEKTPSFYVVEDKGFFHCFGCGAHGDAIGFVMRADNLNFVEAVERLAGEAGIAVPQQTPQEHARAQRQKTLLDALAAAAAFYEAQLWSSAGARARHYLTQRGLDEETIRRFRLGWAPGHQDNGDRQALRRALGGEFPEALLREAGLLRLPEGGSAPYDYFRGRVIFPIGDRAGRTIAFGGRTLSDAQPKYLNSPDTPVFEKGRALYGWSAARVNVKDDAPVIVVEGYMDVIALHRAGFVTAVAPLGTALTVAPSGTPAPNYAGDVQLAEAQLQELWRLSPEPVLCFDGDAAGQRAALRALDRALPLLKPGRSLRFAELPAGEDPDSLIRAAGASALAEVLAAAWPLSDMLWESEVRGRPRKTPEQLAAIQSRLFAQVQLIPDRTLRIEYETLFKKRSDPWQALGRQPRAGRPRWNSGLHEPPPPPPPPPGRRNRELFLGMLVCNPQLIEAWIEEMAALDIPEPELDRLRSAILEVVHGHPGLDANALQQHLGFCGHAETLGALAVTLAKHAGFVACGGDDPEVIKQGLTELLQLLRARQPEKAGGDGHGAPVEPSDEDLERLTALKERELQDGPIGGIGW